MARAMSLQTGDEVVLGLTSWRDGQLRHSFLTETVHGAVLALLGEDSR
jgi:hypothetical protein